MNSGSVLRRDRRIGRHEQRDRHDSRRRHDIAQEVEGEIVVEGRIDGGRHAHQQDRVAVGVGVDDDLGRDVGGRPRLVLDDELLARPLRQPLAHQAGDDVIAAGGGEADHPAHGPVRPDLRRRPPRQEGQRGGARHGAPSRPGGKVQDASARKSHGAPFPWKIAGRQPSNAETRRRHTLRGVRHPCPQHQQNVL